MALIPFFVLLALMLFCVAAAWWEHRRPRRQAPSIPISVLIPCYNDGATLATTLDSVFASYDPALLDVLIGNDASTDDSADVIDALAANYPIRVVHHTINRGKSQTLNQLAALAHHDLLVFIDADTQLNAHAMTDMLTRLHHDPTVGAVSCAYQPTNSGWLPSLQSIDYSMIATVQGGYNIFSALALWGGCIAVRRTAFLEAEGFSDAAITEDVDLAHKLNRNGWRVQQSMIPVKSWVPESMQSWVRQKIRWTAGGFQCLWNHPSVWLKNPMHVVLMTLYAFLSINCLVVLVRNIITLGAVFDLLHTLSTFYPWNALFPLIAHLASVFVVESVSLLLAFTLLNAVYVIPWMQRWRDLGKLILLPPFVMLYFPVYVVVSMMGLGHFVRHAQRLALKEARAW